MDGHQERPDTRLELYLLISMALGIFFAGDWLILRIARGEGRAYPAEFLLLAIMAALLLYLIWLIVGLATVSYAVSEGQLRLSHRLRPPVALDLEGPLALHRWRGRWGWSGGSERDLGVEEVDHFPPLWLFGSGSVWVVVGRTAQGERRAVALRPSPLLLVLLKRRVEERRALSGD